LKANRTEDSREPKWNGEEDDRTRLAFGYRLNLITTLFGLSKDKQAKEFM